MTLLRSGGSGPRLARSRARAQLELELLLLAQLTAETPALMQAEAPACAIFVSSSPHANSFISQRPDARAAGQPGSRAEHAYTGLQLGRVPWVRQLQRALVVGPTSCGAASRAVGR